MKKQVRGHDYELVAAPRAPGGQKPPPQATLRRAKSGTLGHQGGLAKKVVTPTALREVAHYAGGWELSQRQACVLVSLARGSYAPPPGGGRGGLQTADDALVTRLRALVKRHGGWSFWKYDYRLRKLRIMFFHKRS